MWNKYLVEFLGTMMLSYVIFATGNALAIGATLTLIIILGGPISSAVYNPAIAIALYSAGQLSKNDLMPYIICQILGALAGFTVYKQYVNKG
jgi:glycerol uptake facilitator-like aquaporin